MEPSPSAELSFAPVVQIGLVNFHFGKFSVFGDPKVDVTIGAASTPHPARPGDGSDGTRHAGVSFPPKVLETEFGKMQTHQFVAPSGDGSYKIERGFVPSSVNWQQLSQTAWRDLELPNKTLARVYTLGSARLIARTKPIAFAEDEPLSTGQYLVVTIDDPQRGQEHFILLHAPSSKSQCSEPAEADRLLEADGRQFILDWPPHRLGDGSYGAVFKVHDRSRMPYALKVLYERQFLTRTGLMSIRTSDLAHLEGERPAPASDDVIQIPFDEVVNLLLSAMARASEGDPTTTKEAVEKLRKNVVDAFGFSQEKTNLSRLRFDAERKVAEDVRRAFQEGDRLHDPDVQPGDYVEAIASSDEFKKSTAHSALQHFYRDQSESAQKTINLSNYAIVLSYCNFTLKDLLEREWLVTIADGQIAIQNRDPEKEKALAGRVSAPANGAEQRLLGYNLLRLLKYRDRVRVILPYLKGVARGLYTLYLAGKSHHDIKPANVFIKKFADSFQTLLGDFSFVAQAAEVGTTEAVLRDVITTGTIHFRSPEQRDFTEVYQARVVHGAREQTFRLRIHDPKFREPRGGQDRLVFSADREGTLYTIEGATRKEPQTYWEVTLKAESAVLCRKFPAVPQPTQVVVYRMPTLHSDLFGFGALAYDLVSGGKSAERFYEQLRSVDYTDSRHTVDSLVEKYSKRHRSLFPRSSERELNEIFSSFRDGEDMCPPEFVDLILRCMCHRVKDAFVTQTEDAFRSILNKLKELDATFRSKEDTPNLLIAPEKAPEWSLVQERLLEDTLKSA